MLEMFKAYLLSLKGYANLKWKLTLLIIILFLFLFQFYYIKTLSLQINNYIANNQANKPKRNGFNALRAMLAKQGYLNGSARPFACGR